MYKLPGILSRTGCLPPFQGPSLRGLPWKELAVELVQEIGTAVRKGARIGCRHHLQLLRRLD